MDSNQQYLQFKYVWDLHKNLVVTSNKSYILKSIKIL